MESKDQNLATFVGAEYPNQAYFKAEPCCIPDVGYPCIPN